MSKKTKVNAAILIIGNENPSGDALTALAISLGEAAPADAAVVLGTQQGQLLDGPLQPISIGTEQINELRLLSGLKTLCCREQKPDLCSKSSIVACFGRSARSVRDDLILIDELTGAAQAGTGVRQPRRSAS